MVLPKSKRIAGTCKKFGKLFDVRGDHTERELKIAERMNQSFINYKAIGGSISIFLLETV